MAARERCCFTCINYVEARLRRRSGASLVPGRLREEEEEEERQEALLARPCIEPFLLGKSWNALGWKGP